MTGIFGNSGIDRHLENGKPFVSYVEQRDAATKDAETEVADVRSDYYYLNASNVQEAIIERMYEKPFAATLSAMVATENLDLAKFLANTSKEYWTEKYADILLDAMD